MTTVRTLVLPVAGLGKRLRPLTLATPKNLLPLRGRPLLEYALDEAQAIGLSKVILIVSPEHRAQYEAYLAHAGARYPGLTFEVVEQERPLGNGHAILQARASLDPDEPFAVRFCDDVIVAPESTLAKLIGFYDKYRAPVLFLERIPQEDVERYGVVRPEESPEPGLFRISAVVEKPKSAEAPSNLIIIGGYVLTPSILRHLAELETKMEIVDDWLLVTDALLMELKDGKPIYGWEFFGTRLDCGTLEGLKQAEEYLSLLPDNKS